MNSNAERHQDGELMSRVSAGDEGAYRELSTKYLERVLNYSYRIVGTSADAEEVTQEAFFRLWKDADRWKPNAKVSTWLFRVAHNLCIDRIRRQKHIGGEEVELGTDSVRPSRVLARRVVADAVKEAVETLPQRQREALILAHYEGLGNPEVASVLGVSVEAVESLLSRARRSLRTTLSQHRGGGREH